MRHLLFFLFLFPSALFAQSTLFSGRITDEDGKAVSSAHIAVRGAHGTQSGKTGYFSIRLREADTLLVITHISYDTLWIKNPLLKNESVFVMKRSTISIDGVQVYSGKSPPDTIISSIEFSISDYLFKGDSLLLLTYDKVPGKKQKIRLTDNQKNEIASIDVPEDVDQLYMDYLGRSFIYGKKRVYLIKDIPSGIGIVEVDKKEFDLQLKPCIDTVSGRIIFSDYSPRFPAFSYYTYDEQSDTVQFIRFIEDAPLHRMYRYEFYFLKPPEKILAMKLADDLGIDRHMVAANMTGFTDSWYFEPLYAPLFLADDSILIFDHYNNRLVKYSNDFIPRDSVDINYHKQKKPLRWLRSVIQDESTGDLYALFRNSNYHELHQIDKASGNINGNFRLYYRYVENIKVKDGYVYYIYHPFESVQKKFLYREEITY